MITRGEYLVARKRFPLTSDQLELLLAFESCESLQHLAEKMVKDASVVSRNLQQLAEHSPVIVKMKGRWQISPLGRQVNEQTVEYLKLVEAILAGRATQVENGPKKFSFEKTALLIVNAQNGLLNPTLGSRNNNDAELNIKTLLNKWRTGKNLIIHVRHASKSPESTFYRDSKWFDIISDLSPEQGELVIDKSKSSAFTDTTLLDELNARSIENVVITGFTANECLDATARHASEFGFKTYVVSDASASFDITGHDGKLYRADRVHKLTLANLHALCANVVTTASFLS